MEHKLRALIVDDSKGDPDHLLERMTKAGLDCVLLNSTTEALEFIASHHPDIILTNLKMRRECDFGIFSEVKKLNNNTLIIALTSASNTTSLDEMLRSGMFACLPKPVSEKQLEITIQKAIRNKRRTYQPYPVNRPNTVSSHFGNIIGNSEIMQNLFKDLLRIAKSEGNVMISGESGTGKELVARSIHANSGRKHQALIPVDCVALPENLLESELFGYEKGAFTGAESMRRGLLEYADNGTLFLDEICELAPNLQAKLLRAVQESEFRRVGGKKLLKVNIRIISATNKKPDEAVKQGLLREDLFYRLNVIPVQLPPLRARQDDIEALLTYFIEKFDRFEPAHKKRFHPDAVEALKRYSWPGNIRELQNLVERLVSLVDESEIRKAHLPEHIRVHAQHHSDNGFTPFLDQKKQVLQEFEKKYFTNLLIKYRGNISRAAAKAQISRRTLYRMISIYNLQKHT